jgi:hypothetical protein
MLFILLHTCTPLAKEIVRERPELQIFFSVIHSAYIIPVHTLVLVVVDVVPLAPRHCFNCSIQLSLCRFRLLLLAPLASSMHCAKIHFSNFWSMIPDHSRAIAQFSHTGARSMKREPIISAASDKRKVSKRKFKLFLSLTRSRANWSGENRFCFRSKPPPKKKLKFQNIQFGRDSRCQTGSSTYGFFG